jgi:hypothetical protein
LVSSLDDACFIGKVKYIDYEVDDIDTSHYFHTTMHKRREFDYEKEVRIVQQAIPHDGGVILFPGFALASDDQRLARYPNGLLTRFDVASAIESIWLNPNAEQWFLEALQATLVSLGVPKDKLRTSGLGAQPRLATRRVTTLDQQLQERLEKAK